MVPNLLWKNRREFSCTGWLRLISKGVVRLETEIRFGKYNLRTNLFTICSKLSTRLRTLLARKLLKTIIRRCRLRNGCAKLQLNNLNGTICCWGTRISAVLLIGNLRGCMPRIRSKELLLWEKISYIINWPKKILRLRFSWNFIVFMKRLSTSLTITSQ